MGGESEVENVTETKHDNGDDALTGKKGKGSFVSRILNRGKDEKSASDDGTAEKGLAPVKFLQLFRYATHSEKLMVVFANIAAAIHGALMPIFTVLFGSIINKFGSTDNAPTDPSAIDEEAITDEIGGIAWIFLLLGAIAFVTSVIQVRLQLIVAQRVCARLRRRFFESLMSQDYTWYDQNDGGELTARVAGDVNLVQGGIGDKVTSALQFIAAFVVGTIVAFIYGPLLTLVILAVAPLLIIAGSVFGKLAVDSTGDGLGAYGAAGSVATEVIGLIRTVSAYNGQELEAKRYEAELERAYKADSRRSVYTGIGLGATFLIIFSTYGIAFAFGASQVRNGSMEPGDVLTTFFSVLIACMSLGQAAPSFQAFAAAQGAAPRVYEIIERKSEINPLDKDDGETIPKFQGHIRFDKVDFDYAARVKDDLETSTNGGLVLNKFSLDVPPGTSHALVGPSGCGKSTTVRLIERFYDVQNGSITLDDVDVRRLNVRWLRSQIGYVGQMPTLFMLSIRENIALGAAMEISSDEFGKPVLRRKVVTDEEVVDAAKKANAHDFIKKLPEGYDTVLGERGALLSGGQKQRVCIARALIRNPKILILDESTAALDARSERLVQNALENASAGRTTITIAHRLSTVKNADVISVIDHGVVVESGTHSTLLSIQNGAYRALVERQNVKSENANQALDVEKNEHNANANPVVLSDSISKTGRDQQGSRQIVDEPEGADVDKGVIIRAMKMTARNFPFVVLGVLGAALAGAAFPVMSIVFSEVIVVMVQSNNKDEVKKWALMFVVIGGASFVGSFLQHACLGISGERLTRRMRSMAFRSILRQDMAFFDERENSLGALATRLATEATLVKGLAGDTLGVLAYALSTVLCGFIIAYTACWRVAAVVTAVFPLMALSGAIQLKLVTGFDADSEKNFAEAGAVASEAVDNFDTVTSIGVQDVFMEKYDHELEAPIRNGRKTAFVAGVAFGFSEFIAQALWAVSFWVGSTFVRNGKCDFLGLMNAITALLFAGMMLGNISAQVPDVGKARVAATKLFRLLDRETRIDPTSASGERIDIDGDVAVKDVCFEYPTRPDVAVLRGASVTVSHGQTLALVGASGCGKSTMVALIERFYDPCSGCVTIDESKLDDFNLNYLRSKLGYVSQEPDLFNRTIRENIAYGCDAKNDIIVTEEMIVEAAKAANAHDFISELGEGYDTLVGSRGNRLSGGQRQRIAIARAIVRNPRVLLLDEATSALDAISERVVQNALDKASSGRTTVAIAHRLSTVKDADVIAVVSRGKIVEVGTHEQLLKIPGGEYANLVKNQMSESEDDAS